MNRHPLALTVHQTGRSARILGIILQNHTGYENRLEVENFKSLVPTLLVRVQRQKVLLGSDAIPNPFYRQRISHCPQEAARG